jgi:hypothetical protein
MFYAYNSAAELGAEKLGSDGRVIWRDIKTTRGAIARLKRLGWPVWTLYTFANFYDNASFRKVAHHG